MSTDRLTDPTSYYDSISKSFGPEAERLNREEYRTAVDEIVTIGTRIFPRMEALIPLDDKLTFGDIDIVVISNVDPDQSDEDRIRSVFGESILRYHHLKNDKMDSVLIRLASGKCVQVDFMRTKNIPDFEAKMIHGSKGHSSSVIGTLARSLGYKFSIDGFYKRFTDARGQSQDILITKDLFEAMRILGLDPEKWKDAKCVDDIIYFIATSKFFNPAPFSQAELNHNKRSTVTKRSVQRHMYDQLSAMEPKPIPDHKSYFSTNFPDHYQSMVNSELKISENTSAPETINGKTIMTAFQLPPSPKVGEIIRFIRANHPSEVELNDTIIADIKEHFPDLS